VFVAAGLSSKPLSACQCSESESSHHCIFLFDRSVSLPTVVNL